MGDRPPRGTNYIHSAPGSLTIGIAGFGLPQSHYKCRMPDDCVFCQIVAGESPVSAFYEDEVVLGLMTIGPVTTGHAMVIPRTHFASLAEMDEATGRHLWTVAQRTAEALRHSGVRCEGVNLFLADGEAAFQDVF